MFLGWCESTGRDLEAGVRALGSFVGWLRTTPVQRAGAGVGRARSPARINHVLAAVREFAKHAVSNSTLDPSVLAVLYEVSDDRHLPAGLRPEGSGLRYLARPRHRQRERRRGGPSPVRQDETEALLRAARSWRDRFVIVLLWFCGLRIGEALGLRRCDLHLAGSAVSLGCAVPGPHLHVVGRDNPNGARAKSGERAVPVRGEVLACYDRYLGERDGFPAAQGCDFVLVNLFHRPLGQPMHADTVRAWLADASRRAGLERPVRPHMFRHATATELLARGAGLDVVRDLLGHASIHSTEGYANSCAGHPARRGRPPWPVALRGGLPVTANALAPVGQQPTGPSPDRLGQALDLDRLAGLGWDRDTQVLTPPPAHRLLGWRECPVARCGGEGRRSDGLCTTCVQAWRAEPALDFAVFCAQGVDPARRRPPGLCLVCRVPGFQ